MSCVHDGGFGSSIGCAKCNAELAGLLDLPPCSVPLGTLNGSILLCNLQRGHFGDHSHTRMAALYCDHPGRSCKVSLVEPEPSDG